MKIKGVKINMPDGLQLNPIQDKSLNGFFSAHAEKYLKKGVKSVEVDTRSGWALRFVSMAGLTAIDAGLLFRPSLPEGVPDHMRMKHIDPAEHENLFKEKFEELHAGLQTRIELSRKNVQERSDKRMVEVNAKQAEQQQKMADNMKKKREADMASLAKQKEEKEKAFKKLPGKIKSKTGTAKKKK